MNSNAHYAVYTAQLAKGVLPRHAHRSLPGALSRAPGHDRAQMIIFRTESTTFGRRIWRHSFGRFPGSSCTKCPKGKGPWKRLVDLISSGGQTGDGSGRAGRWAECPAAHLRPKHTTRRRRALLVSSMRAHENSGLGFALAGTHRAHVSVHALLS